MPALLDFQALFQGSPNAYMVLDRHLRFVAANDAYLRVTGTRFEDLVGRHIIDVFPNDPADPGNESAQRLRQSLERVVGTAAPDVIALIPYRLPGRDGGVAERYWSATHTPVLDEHGDVAYVLQHTVDVTELQQLRGRSAVRGDARGETTQLEAGVLRRAQEVQETNVSLERERSRLRQLFEQAPGFMCFLRGPEHVFEIANAGYLQLVGHRDVLGRTAREAMPELASQGYLELLHHVYTTGEAFVGRGMRVLLHRHPGAPPAEYFLDFSYQLIREAGGPSGILVQGYDITAQKRQEAENEALLERERAARAAAEQAEARGRFLAESIPQQVWTATPNGDLDFVNGRALDYYGIPSSGLLGTAWQDAVHPDDRSACLDRWRQSLRTGDEYEMLFRLRRADSTYRWHLGRAVALRGADGRIAKWFGTNTDMDELTRARDELRRRAEFDQQLIGIVSHDLRNPLNAIGMATSLLLKLGRLDEQHVKVVSRIMSSSDRAVRLIRDFLDFTQARVSGRIPVSCAPANIREIARQAFEEVHLAHADRTAFIEHTGEETGSWDADRIAQLIGNLVSNAFQHGAIDGAVRVATRGTRDEVVIEVQNDGTPIPEGDLTRLFEPFERGTGARPQSGRSIGLGLYIARQIVCAHDGRIDVRSTADEGTVFTVRLPRSPHGRDEQVAVHAGVQHAPVG